MPDARKTSAADTSQLAPLIQMVREQNTTLATISEKQKRIDELEAAVKGLQEQHRRQSISLPGTEDMVKRGEFSWSRAIGSVARGDKSLAPKEWEVSDQARKRISGDVEKRIHTTLTDSLGGFLVPEEIHGSLIPKLDAEAIIGKLGITVLNPKGYPFRVNKITGGLTAYMIGEATRATESTMAIGQVNLQPKKCSARAIVTNEQVMWGTPQTDGIVMDDLTRRIALKEDQQVLHGTGSENEVYGIMVQAATAANTDFTTIAGGSTSQVLFGDFNKAIAALAEANADLTRIGAVMHPRAKYNLFRQLFQGVATNATEALGAGFIAGMPIYSDARFKEWTGMDIASTTQMSVAQNTDDTWIVLGNWADYFFARFGGLVLAKSDVASDGTYHAFTDDVVHCKAVTWFDGACIRPKSLCIITGYNYADLD